MKNRITLSLVIYSFLVITEVASQPSWKSIGLDTMSIYSFQNDGDFLYASAPGSDGAMYRSSDLGDNWIEKSTGLPQDATVMLALTNFHNKLYVSCSHRGIYVSDNAAESWSNLFTNNYIGAISVAPLPWDIIMGGGSRIKGLAEVIVSENGTGWHAVHTGLPLDASIYALTIQDTAAYAGNLYGVFRLTMHEDTWSPAHEGMTGSINALGFNDDYLFAGGRNNGVYRSLDGINWTGINSGLQTGSETFTSFAFDESYVFVSASGNHRGVFYSTNHGDQWMPLNMGLPVDANVLTLFASNGYLYAGTENKGAYRIGLSEITAVDETDADEIENILITPNPCHGVFTISIPPETEIQHLEIVNQAGQLIYEAKQVVNGKNIDLTSFPDGMYFIKIETAKGFSTKTVVIQH